jgi:hypothetical protein
MTDMPMTSPEADPMRAHPKRIQRQRMKGWRMPEGVVYVGRPTQWGNPFSLGALSSVECVEAYRRLLLCDYKWLAAFGLGWTSGAWLSNFPEPRLESLRTLVSPLRGKDLACWCPLDQPCHADVLLELANAKGGSR